MGRVVVMTHDVRWPCIFFDSRVLARVVAGVVCITIQNGDRCFQCLSVLRPL